VPHLAAAITGTAALLRASGLAFEVVKVLGVAYLLCMAWMTWRDKGALVVIEDLPPRSARPIMASAVLVNLLNPKLTIFFFAFLPQFVPAGAGQPVLRMLALSAVFMVMTFVVFALYGGVRRLGSHPVTRGRGSSTGCAAPSPSPSSPLGPSSPSPSAEPARRAEPRGSLSRISRRTTTKGPDGVDRGLRSVDSRSAVGTTSCTQGRAAGPTSVAPARDR